MIVEFAKWINSLEDYIEAELGTIPNFECEEVGSLRYKGRDFPFMVFYDKPPLFSIGREGMNDWFFNRLRSKKISTKETGLGALIFSLVHDIIHVYQIRDGDLLAQYNNWLEGLAQLYAFKICNKMYGEAKPENFNLLKKGDSKSMREFITISLESKGYKNSILSYLTRKLTYDTKKLRDAKILEEKEFSFSNYPFGINQEIIRKIEEKLSFRRNGKVTKEEIEADPYMIGAYQLSRLSSKNLYTLKELMDMPLPNKALENF